MNAPEVSVEVPAETLFQDLGEEAVLLSVKSGVYYSLDQLGTRMWALLAEHGSTEPVIRALQTEYEVEEGRLREDLLAFIDELAARELIAIARPR